MKQLPAMSGWRSIVLVYIVDNLLILFTLWFDMIGVVSLTEMSSKLLIIAIMNKWMNLFQWSLLFCVDVIGFIMFEIHKNFEWVNLITEWNSRWRNMAYFDIDCIELFSGIDRFVVDIYWHLISLPKRRLLRLTKRDSHGFY